MKVPQKILNEQDSAHNYALIDDEMIVVPIETVEKHFIDRSESEINVEAMVMPPNFELVQVHEANKYAEIVVRDRKSYKVYAGNLKLVDNPRAYYPPDYFIDKVV